MIVSFSYTGVTPVDVPDKNLIAVIGPRDRAASGEPRAVVRAALDQPVGSASLRALAASARKALILFDDNTRPTPVHLIVPWLLEELHRGGVRDVAFLAASGTHRTMTPSEKEGKLGAGVCQAYEVLDHRWDDPNQLVTLEGAGSNVPVEVNRLVLDADLLVGVGHVAPHRMAGFGGGAKIVQPGVCGAATTGRTHWMAAQFRSADLLGRAVNAVRMEMERVAEVVGLKAVFNVVLNTRNEMAACFFGAPVAAHRRAARLAAEIFGVVVPALADIVLIESFPGDLDMWQASKALAAAELMVRPGGVVILVAPCPEGVSGEHPAMLEFGYQSPSRVAGWVGAGVLTDLVVAAELAVGGRVIRERAHGILVSPGIPPEEAQQLGFEWAASPSEALNRALHRVGKDAGVLVVRHGGEILPLVDAG